MTPLWPTFLGYWVRTLPFAYRRSVRPYEGAAADVFGDLVEAWRRRDLWLALARQGTLARLRGTLLGPLWLPLSYALAVAGIGLIYANLLDIPLKVYVPYLAIGWLLWNVIQGVLSQGGRSLREYKNLVLQTQTPLLMYPLVIMARQLIASAYALPLLFAALVWGGIWPGFLGAGLALLGIALFVSTLLAVCIILSIVCAFLPDLTEAIASGIRFIFFLTPVLWMPESRAMPEAVWEWNGFYHLIHAVRGPLLGQSDVSYSFWFVALLGTGAWALALYLYWASARSCVTRL